MTNFILSAIIATNMNVAMPVDLGLEIGDIAYMPQSAIAKTNEVVAKKEEYKIFKDMSETLLGHNFELIYKDMFVATKENLGYHPAKYVDRTTYKIETKEIPGHYDIAMDSKGVWRDVYIPAYTEYITNGMETKTYLLRAERTAVEANPVAKWFFDNNIWTPTYILTMTLNYSAVRLLNEIDTTGISGYVFTLGLTCAEAYAINTWKDYLNDDFYFEAPLFVMKF